MIFRFDEFELDADRRELRRQHGAEPLELQAKVFDVLHYLVRNADHAVGKDEILDRVWGDVIVSEASLTRCISLARRALGESEGDARIIETLRGHGYRIGVIVETEPLASVAASDASADGDRDVPAPLASGSAVEDTARSFGAGRLAAFAILAVVLGLAWLARPHADLFSDPARLSPPRPTPDSVAVLAFGEVGSDPAGAGELLALETTRSLGSVDGLRVTSAASSFQMGRGFDVDPVRVGRALGVDAVVLGEVRRMRDRIDVSVELVDAESGTLRWSAAYQGSGADDELTRLRGELVSDVTQAMRVIAPDPMEHARSPIAIGDVDYYLGGRARVLARTREDQIDQIRAYEQAIELDPQRVLPYVALAMVYERLWTRDPHGSSWLDRGEAAALRALELEPTSSEALAAYGTLRRWRRDWEGAEKSYRLAIEHEPTAWAYRGLAQLYCTLGRPEDALAPALDALGRDPLGPSTQKTAGRVYYYLGDGETAVAHLKRSLELDPRSEGVPGLLAAAYQMAGRPAEAREAFLLVTPPWMRPLLRIHGRIASDDAGLRLVLELGERAHGPCGRDAWESSMAWASIRDEERAFACMEAAADHHLWYALSEPAWAAYRDHPRFLAALERGGFPPPPGR